MKGWKTFIVQVVAGLFAGAGAMGAYNLEVPPEQAAEVVVTTVENANEVINTVSWSGVGWAILNIILRAVTSTPIFQK